MSQTTERGQLTGRLRRSLFGLPRNVTLLGVTSFFADVSSEMIYPLIPIFLTTTLGAPVSAVGLVEGVAESTASLSKLGSGWFSDRVGRRLPLVVGGYSISAVAKILLALAVSWPFALFARFVDRLGKGTRSSPRDALIADSTSPDQRGRAFGLHRALDTGGAVAGPLLGLLLVAVLNDRLRAVFLIAAIPGFLSVLFLMLVKEPKAEKAGEQFSLRESLTQFGSLDARLQLFLVAVLLFSLGNSSDTFLLLRGKDLGLSTTAVVLAYVVYNFVYMSAALPAGIAADLLGRRRVFILGLLVFAAVYAGFALAASSLVIWPLFAIYGFYVAATDGVGKALLSDLAPPDRRASVLGLYGLITGLAALLASVVAGQLWDHVGDWAPFALGSGAAVTAALLLLFVSPRRVAVS